MTDQTRRDFLKTVATSATAVACTCAFGSTGCLVPPSPESTTPPVDRAGQLSFDLGVYPPVNQVGGAIILRPSNASAILFMRVTETEYRATGGICTHKLCPVSYIAKENVIECPCHGARFSIDGKVMRAPATAPLNAYIVRTDPVTKQQVIDTRGTQMPARGADGRVRFERDFFPDLDEVESFFAFTPIGALEPLLILRFNETTYYAYAAYSTASHTILDYDPEVDRLIDTSAQMAVEYNIDGSVHVGPAGTAPLRILPLSLQGTEIVINASSLA
jgi:cytochrome b6-f complex iron-sulfur subunit